MLDRLFTMPLAVPPAAPVAEDEDEEVSAGERSVLDLPILETLGDMLGQNKAAVAAGLVMGLLVGWLVSVAQTVAIVGLALAAAWLVVGQGNDPVHLLGSSLHVRRPTLP